MHADKPTRPDRLELVARALLALALITAVTFAWANGGGIGTELLGHLRG